MIVKYLNSVIVIANQGTAVEGEDTVGVRLINSSINCSFFKFGFLFFSLLCLHSCECIRLQQLWWGARR